MKVQEPKQGESIERYDEESYREYLDNLEGDVNCLTDSRKPYFVLDFVFK